MATEHNTGAKPRNPKGFTVINHGWLDFLLDRGVRGTEMALLLHLSRYYRPKHQQREFKGRAYDLPPGTISFSQTHAAGVLGVSRSTIGRSLISLSEKGIVTYSGDPNTTLVTIQRAERAFSSENWEMTQNESPHDPKRDRGVTQNETGGSFILPHK